MAACNCITEKFPKSELHRLTPQLQRAAVSVPANIAEGKGRGVTGAYLNHLSIADGSHAELDTHIGVAERLGYVSRQETESLTEQLEEVGRMLTGLR